MHVKELGLGVNCKFKRIRTLLEKLLEVLLLRGFILLSRLAVRFKSRVLWSAGTGDFDELGGRFLVVVGVTGSAIVFLLGNFGVFGRLLSENFAFN